MPLDKVKLANKKYKHERKRRQKAHHEKLRKLAEKQGAKHTPYHRGV